MKDQITDFLKNKAEWLHSPIDKFRSTIAAFRETIDSDKNWYEKAKSIFAILTGTYKAEKAELKNKKEEVMAETEGEIDAVLESDETMEVGFEGNENAIFYATLERNFGKKASAKLKKALDKTQKGEKLNDKETSEVAVAGFKSLLDLMYVDGKRLSEKSFVSLVGNALKGEKKWVTKYLGDRFKDAFMISDWNKLNILGKFGVGFFDANKVKEAFGIVTGKVEATADDISQKAAPLITKVFFPNTGVKKVGGILTKVSLMIRNNTIFKPETMASILYQISPKDLNRFITKLGGDSYKVLGHPKIEKESIEAVA